MASPSSARVSGNDGCARPRRPARLSGRRRGGRGIADHRLSGRTRESRRVPPGAGRLRRAAAAALEGRRRTAGVPAALLASRRLARLGRDGDPHAEGRCALEEDRARLSRRASRKRAGADYGDRHRTGDPRAPPRTGEGKRARLPRHTRRRGVQVARTADRELEVEDREREQEERARGEDAGARRSSACEANPMRHIAAMFALLCSAAPATPPAQQRIVLLVDEIKAIRNFPVVLAERLGYLEGVTVMNIRDDAPTAEMLMNGRVDAGMAYYHHTVVNRAAGRNFEAVVTLGVTPGTKVLVANHARDKYRTPKDLAGSRIIAGGAGSSKTTVANALLLAGGHAISDYTR